MDYRPLPYVLFDAQGDAGEPDRPFEVWEVCLRDACVAPVGWDRFGRAVVPGCPLAVMCECKRSAIGALAFMHSRHATVAAARVALEVLLEDWDQAEEVKLRAVLDRRIVERARDQRAVLSSRFKRVGVAADPRIPLARRRAVPASWSLDEDDVPF